MNKNISLDALVFGIHPIIELLKAKKRKLLALYTTKPTPKEWKTIESYLPPYPIAIQYVSRDVLHRMAGTNDHQGVIGYAQPFPYYTKPFDTQKFPFIVFLDAIQDPRNLGAIIRSMYCTGASGLLLAKKNSAPLGAVALKAAAGLAEHLPIRIVASAQEALQELKAAKYTIYLALLQGQDARACTFTQPMCMIIGNEATGISKEFHKSGIAITLPQIRTDIAYNASVAAGILLFLIGSQHKKI
ncbi:MAG TPA: RNA methyltransferase [Candidatus Babeliales bacterium]|nr:RNA methyltransferase [Candidatus Babeliales bacterium]